MLKLKLPRNLFLACNVLIPVSVSNLMKLIYTRKKSFGIIEKVLEIKIENNLSYLRLPQTTQIYLQKKRKL